MAKKKLTTLEVAFKLDSAAEASKEFRRSVLAKMEQLLIDVYEDPNSNYAESLYQQNIVNVTIKRIEKAILATRDAVQDMEELSGAIKSATRSAVQRSR